MKTTSTRGRYIHLCISNDCFQYVWISSYRVWLKLSQWLRISITPRVLKQILLPRFHFPGLGRTGVLIACFLVYSLRIRANDAIRLVRKKRPKSVQTSGQILCVQQFEHYMLPQTIVFSSKWVELKSIFNIKLKSLFVWLNAVISETTGSNLKKYIFC